MNKILLDCRRWSERLERLLGRCYDVLFPLPYQCPVCGRTAKGLTVCDDCRQQALQKRSQLGQCQRCHSFGVYSRQCANCRDWPDYLAANIAIWPYEGAWKDLIQEYKFHNRPWLAQGLGRELLPFVPRDCDGLVPVPLHPNRLRQRGYNQSLLLAQAVADASQGRLRCEELLLRVRDTPHQTGLPRQQRLENLHHAFALSPGAQVAGRRLVVVDDVFTTGATLRACAQVLYQHGAASVVGLTLASGTGRF